MKRDVSDSISVNIVQRKRKVPEKENMTENLEQSSEENGIKADWKKIFLLIVAITVHNIPGIIRYILPFIFHIKQHNTQ